MITLITPFAGKRFCFDDYYRGIQSIDYPRDQIFAYWYDNSNDEEFSKLLKDKIGIFKNNKLVTDTSQHYVIENTSDYNRINERVFTIYSTILKDIPDNDYMFIVEDDVEIPNNTVSKFIKIMESDDKIGTVSGNLYNRRYKDFNGKCPIAWDITFKKVFPKDDTSNEGKYVSDLIKTARFGLEQIGSAHTGCWFSRTAIVKKVGFSYQEDGLMAVDCTWGWRLRKAGYKFMMDWETPCKHYYMWHGEKRYS